MPLEWAISLRYLRATRSGGAISFVTLVAGLGVGLGVAALVVAMAVMNGYQVNLLQAMAGALPHVSIHPATQATFPDPEGLRELIVATVHPRSIARYASLDTLLRKAGSPAAPLQAVTLRGIEPAIEADEVGFLAFLDDGSAGWKALSTAERLGKARELMLRLDGAEPPRTGPAGSVGPVSPAGPAGASDAAIPLLISRTLAARLGVQVGDAVSLLEFPRGGGFVPLPRPQRLVVHGLFETGILAFDEAVALTGLNGLLRIAPAEQLDNSLGLRLERPLDAGRAAAALRGLELPKSLAFQVFSWLESNKGLFQVILLQKVMLFLVLMLIVLIASFGMISALVMLVTEKTREITILKALGARERTIRRIFLLQGVLIGAGGLVAGLALGLLICWGLSSFALFTIPPGVYPGSDRIPVLISAADVLWVVLGTLVISVGATQFPAFKAMRLRIVEGLRRG
jgi:lipoprotein-releasing system permease protein